MATERVYSPDTCEPFDVSPSKARQLVLEKGWTRSPWTKTVTEVEDEPAPRGRGRRRRVAEEVVQVEPEVEVSEEAEFDIADENWP